MGHGSSRMGADFHGSELGPYSCRCDVCQRITYAGHLKPKKVYAGDKRHAETLMVEAVKRLAREHDFALSEERADQLVVADAARGSAAYLAYGHGLVERLSGYSEGPPLLYLWRLISRDANGRPLSRFGIQLEDFRRAEKQLVKVMI